jgi:hypothetical protein
MMIAMAMKLLNGPYCDLSINTPAVSIDEQRRSSTITRG